MMSTTSNVHSVKAAAQALHGFGFNVLPIAAGEKKPTLTTWKEWTERRQTLEDVEAFSWNEDGGVGLVCDFGLQCIDYDVEKNTEARPRDGSPVDYEAVATVCEALGLGRSYPWVSRSGSHTGFHVWVRCEDDLSEHYDSGNARWEPLEGGPHFHHIEHRWKGVQTVAPPSHCIARDGRRAEWLHGIPTEAPASVTGQALLEALGKIATPASKKKKTAAPPGRAHEHRAAEVVVYQDEYETAKEAIRARFPLLEYVQEMTGTADVLDAGHEWRVGRPGAGLGGWHVTKDGRTWNTFADGSGELGGDCFDAVGHKLFGSRYDSRDATMWRAVLHEAATLTGVTLPERSPRGRSDYGHVSKDGSTGDGGHAAEGAARSSGKVTQAEAVQEWIGSRFRLRWNSILLRIEWTLHEEEQWRRISDMAEAQWRVNYEKYAGKRVGRDCFTDYVQDMAYTAKHDPYVDYFDSLPPYSPADGDHIAAMAELLTVGNPELMRRHFTKWLVGAYACAYHDARSDGGRNRNELFFVLTGPQGVGKTLFLRSLVPPALLPYKLEKKITESKDSLQELAQAFLFLDDELRTLSAADTDSVKALLSKQAFVYRPPYAKHPEEFSRRVSFCGATNSREFLRDVTGSRRFLVHEVAAVNMAAVDRFDVSKVWAQARYLYEQGYVYYLTGDEQREAEEHNKSFTVPMTEEDLLLRYFEPIAWGDLQAKYYTTSEVAMEISRLHDREHTSIENRGINGDASVRDGVPRLRYDSPGMVARLGSILGALGFTKRNKKTGGAVRSKWAVREKQRHEWTDQERTTEGGLENDLF
jgi:hypothetical protein